MKTHTSLTYSLAGLQPPVFVVTSLSEPQWDPIEMQHRQREDGQFEFWQDFDAEEGEHQYKFRLGPGDWWALDETKQIVDDGSGNRNNLLLVEAPRKDSLLVTRPDQKATAATTPVPDQKPEATTSQRPDQNPEATTKPSANQTPETTTHPEQKSGITAEQAPIPKDPISKPVIEQPTNVEAPAKLPAGEDSYVDVDSGVEDSGSFEDTNDAFVDEKHAPAPLFSHETGFDLQGDSDLDDGSSLFSEEDESSRQRELEDIDTPLFRHETLSKISTEGENEGPLLRHETTPPEIEFAPLFRHESFYAGLPGMNNSSAHHSRTQTLPHDPLERLDTAEVVIEQLPTERDAILQHLQRSSTRSAEQELIQAGTPSSPSQASSTHSGSLLRSVSNASQGSSYQLGSINETEEEPVVSHAVIPGTDFAAVLAAAVADRDDKLVQLSGNHGDHHHHHGHKREQSCTGPADLLTPPMTPDTNTKHDAEEGRFERFPVKTHQAPLVSTLTDGPAPSIDSLIGKHSSRSEVDDEPRDASVGLISSTKGFFKGLGSWIFRVCGGSGRASGVIAVAVGIAAAVYRFRDSRETVAPALLGVAYPYNKGVRRNDGPGIKV